jgi:anti-anti-sigma factor
MRQPTTQGFPQAQRKRRLTVRGANFSLVVSREADVETIAIDGELDVATAVRLTEAIRQAEAGTAARIVVDLGEVSFLDRSALAMLWKTRVRLRRWGDRLEFLPPVSETVQRFIDQARMSELLYGAGPE